MKKKIRFIKNSNWKLAMTTILGILALSILPLVLLNNRSLSINVTLKKSMVSQKKESTYSLSSLCAVNQYNGKLKEFLDGNIDCKNVFSIQNARPLTSFNHAFIKVTPLVPKTKKIELKLQTLDLATFNSTFKNISLFDDKGKEITGVVFQKSQAIVIIGQGENARYVVNKTFSNGSVTLTLNTPSRISKIVFNNLEHSINASVKLYTDRPAEIIKRGVGSNALNESLNQNEIRFNSSILEGNQLILEHDDYPNAVPKWYDNIVIYDETNSIIDKKIYTITYTPNTSKYGRIVFNFSKMVRISRILFTNLVGKQQVITKFNKVINASEIVYIEKPYIVSDRAEQNGIFNLNSFENIKKEYKYLSKLKKISLLNKDNKIVPYTITAMDPKFYSDSDSEKCNSLSECSDFFQPTKDSLTNGLHFNDVSYFAIASLDKFFKMDAIGNNIQVEFVYTSKNNYNFKGVNYNWQSIPVTMIPNMNNSIKTILKVDEYSEISRLNCESLLKPRFAWAMPKACDFLTQVFSYTNTNLTNYNDVETLNLKGNAPYEYPWWDIQKVIFNRNANTSLELDFKTYNTTNQSFNTNLAFYLDSLFKKNANTLDKLVIKGPLTSKLAQSISKLTSLKELVIDGAQLTDFTFLNSLTNLEKITIKNTLLDNVKGLLVGSSKIKNIDLSFNRIKSIPSGSFSGLTELVNVNLSNNMIESLDLTSLPTGNKIETLDLSHNKFQMIPNLATLTGLKKINVSYNQLTDIPSGIVALSSLNSLIASNNQLSATPIASTPSSLQELDIRNNPIHTFPTNLQTTHPLLKSLSIGGALYELNKDANNSKYNDIVAYITSNATKLTTLRIENMNLLNSTISDLLTKLTSITNLNLKVLSFANNQLHNFSSTSQKIPNSLIELDLSNQNGLSIVPSFISSLTSLKKLNLSDNSFTTIQKIDWPQSLDEIDVSKNPLGSFATLVSLKGIKTIIAKNLANSLEIGVEDYATFAESFNNKDVKLIVSSNAFNPNKLYEAQNPYKLLNVNLFLVDPSTMKMKKVNIFDQFMIIYENITIATLRKELRLEDFTEKNVRDYNGDDGRVFYSRGPIDPKSIGNSNDLKKYLDKSLQKISNIAKSFQIIQQEKEIAKGIKLLDKASISSSSTLIAAVVLVAFLILANSGFAIYYFAKKNKKKVAST